MIYVHIPFCRSFCTYCDFYSEIACKGKDETMFISFADALCAEIRNRRSEIEQTLGVNTLYIGGGTPSVLPLSILKRIVKELGIKDFEEFTVEVNPDDISREYVEGLSDLGVNRISMGVQTLDNELLKWMNRRHSSRTAIKAYSLLREKFNNISLDLIFGFSNLSFQSLEMSLDKFIELRPNHISAYQLSIEPNSVLATMLSKGSYTEPTQQFCSQQYDLICRRLSSEGYIHYEISSWALPGYEAIHNSAYWLRESYIGFGPSSHSFIRGRDAKSIRSWNSESLTNWSSSSELLSPLEEMEEEIMLGLRTSRGIDSHLLHPKVLSGFISRGLLIWDNNRVRIPENKFFVSDDIISELI